MKFSSTRWHGFFGAIIGGWITSELFIPGFARFLYGRDGLLLIGDDGKMFIILCGAALFAVPGAAIGFLKDWRRSQKR